MQESTIVHINITDQKTILGDLISVKITAWLPTKMFPELLCQDYRPEIIGL